MASSAQAVQVSDVKSVEGFVSTLHDFLSSMIDIEDETERETQVSLACTSLVDALRVAGYMQVLSDGIMGKSALHSSQLTVSGAGAGSGSHSGKGNVLVTMAASWKLISVELKKHWQTEAKTVVTETSGAKNWNSYNCYISYGGVPNDRMKRLGYPVM
jgi:hypothetical protein